MLAQEIARKKAGEKRRGFIQRAEVHRSDLEKDTLRTVDDILLELFRHGAAGGVGNVGRGTPLADESFDLVIDRWTGRSVAICDDRLVETLYGCYERWWEWRDDISVEDLKVVAVTYKADEEEQEPSGFQRIFVARALFGEWGECLFAQRVTATEV